MIVKLISKKTVAILETWSVCLKTKHNPIQTEQENPNLNVLK